MTFDRNPKFGADASYENSARRVADLLWETTGGQPSQFPRSYIETLQHDFADGKVSMLELIDRVDLKEDATYEEYCEVIDALMSVDPGDWPDPDSVQELQTSKLPYNVEPEFDFSEFDFADKVMSEETVVEEGQASGDPLSAKMEMFFKKVIASVYLDGVDSVTDAQGNPPAESNNYLMAEDGKSFSGIFYDQQGQKPKQFPFSIIESSSGQWSIKY
jgi:hypothetical protein